MPTHDRDDQAVVEDHVEVVEEVEVTHHDLDEEPRLGEPGRPLRHSPFVVGFFGGLGLLTAYWLFQQVVHVGNIVMMVVVAMFLAAGLNPLTEWFERRGLRRSWAVLAVIVLVLAGIAGFVAAIVPVISEQVAALTRNAPGWLDMLLENERIQELNEDYDIVDKAKDYIADGDFAGKAFGGVLGFGLAVVNALFNAFVITVLTLYFLASLNTTKGALYQLAPASRRDRVTKLGDEVLRGIGGYVSGAFVVAVCASLCSLVFLPIVGLGDYAVALSFVVGLLSLIPMVGATIALVIVSAIGLTVSVGVGIACVVYYTAYQQVENYLIYPRVMQRSVDVPGSVTVVAALFGGALFGVVGALMAVPTAAAILLLTREVVIRRQDQR